MIKEGIFWDRRSVHSWREEESESAVDYDRFIQKNPDSVVPGDGVYVQNETEEIPFDRIDRKLNEMRTSRERCEYLIQLDGQKAKNRFVHSG